MRRKPKCCWRNTRSLWMLLRYLTHFKGNSLCRKYQSNNWSKHIFLLKQFYVLLSEHIWLRQAAATGHSGAVPVSALYHTFIRGHAAPTQPGVEAVHGHIWRETTQAGDGQCLPHCSWEGWRRCSSPRNENFSFLYSFPRKIALFFRTQKKIFWRV